MFVTDRWLVKVEAETLALVVQLVDHLEGRRAAVPRRVFDVDLMAAVIDAARAELADRGYRLHTEHLNPSPAGTAHPYGEPWAEYRFHISPALRAVES